MDENRNKRAACSWADEYKGLNKEIDTSLQVEISDNTYSITLMLFIW